MRANQLNGYIWDEAETLPRAQLEKLQLERLQSCVQRVANSVPFYRDKLAKAGVSPDSIRSLSDISRLPFTSKSDLRDHYPLGLLATPASELVRLHASSGTTGKPTVVGYTQKDIELWSNLIARSLAAAGVTKEDVVQNAYGYGLFTGGLGIHYGVERIGATIVPVSGGNTQRQIMLMQDLGSTVLCSTPSYALVIAEALAKEGIAPETLSLKAGVFGAEPWSEGIRQQIQTRLGVPALNIYGLSEVIGPGVAMECPQQEGMHIFEDHFIPEVIDPDTGEPLPDGQVGELVFSCITKEAMPLIRYRTRDRTRLMREDCACGRTLVRMDRILGRTDDMLIIRGVNVFPSQIETVLLRSAETEPQYQILVDRGENHLDNLTVMVEAAQSTVNDPDQKGLLQSKLAQQLKNALGISCAVRVVGPQEIQRSEGKAVRVVDNRSL